LGIYYYITLIRIPAPVLLLKYLNPMSRGFKILIIDDEKELCELIQLILKDENYQVECAHTLKEGVRRWMNLQPSILILDNFLPDGSGLDFINQVPEVLFKSKVIVITGEGKLSKERAQNLGVEFFIEKPFSLKMIRELVQEIIMVQEN
jgi:two-component system, OmpR family, response regulator